MKFCRKILAACMVLVLAGGCAQKSNELSVVTEKKFELGDEVSLKPENFLTEIPSEDVLKEITVTSDLMDVDAYNWNGFKQTAADKNKEYLSVGTYTITLHYQGESYPVRLIVQDTVMPEFVSPSAVITVPAGKADFDFSRVYQVEDKGEVTFRVDGSYDINTPGKYPVTLVATDQSGNSNSIEITLNVVGDSQVITPDTQYDNESPVPETSIIDETVTETPIVEDTDTSSSEQDSSTTVENTTPTQPACAISYVPDGMTPYRTFEECYQAGTAWNSQSEDHYFFYMEGKDDCGNTVYFLSLGSGSVPNEQSGSDSSQDSGK